MATSPNQFPYHRSCKGKARYSQRTAEIKAEKLSKSDPWPLHAYFCDYCGYWHIGHEPVKALKNGNQAKNK